MTGCRAPTGRTVRSAAVRLILPFAGALTCLALIVTRPCAARGDEDVPHHLPGSGMAVIPPGQEAALAAMLGRGAPLPDGCSFASGAIERSFVRGVYRCPGGDVVIELQHPSAASGGLRTEKMAIVTVDGTPPAALLAVLERSVRQGEGGFQWSAPKPSGPIQLRPDSPDPIQPDFPERYPLFGALLIGLGQTLVIVLGLCWGILRLPRLPADRS